ncbi:hypothetical protein TD95_004238 [Thielaviopsis punctulata]|uniref:ERCC4 domain-containing protein n=1 Tax=Thielaviopsis punctulata TaxID=72032 RepID=A0A0F4Z9F9_9PEZI|nr:hypothetical protein TD95_004238 [Thielaviopsis punctulata]
MASSAAPAQTPTPGLLPPVKLSLPLKFQQEIFQAVRAQDALVVMARGLGLLRLVTNLLHSYDAAGNNLILLMGANDRETAVIGRSLVEQKITSGSLAASRARGLTTFDAKDAPMARSETYQRGGIFAVTPRILIGDMLSGIIRADAITGIVAIHADRFTPTSNEAFILRVYREKNRTGFLKAFSDNPESFTRGFSQLSKMLGSLFLRSVSLWPRFQVSVAASLEGKRRAEVIELEVPLTPAMMHIQNAIKECVELCIQEIRKTNSSLGLDLEDWDAKTVMMESFDVMIRRQLEPNWHRITAKTRRIVADLSVLRDLLRYVLEYDCVAFLEHLDAVHEAHSPAPGSLKSSESPWFYFDATHVIFETARKRVYAAESLTRSGNDIDSLRPVLEELPKWAVLSDVLDEIDKEVQAAGPPKDDSSGAILVMCKASETCRQLRDFLQTKHLRPHDYSSRHFQEEEEEEQQQQQQEEESAAYMLRRKLRRYLARKKEASRMKAALYADTQKALAKAVDLTTGQRRSSSSSTSTANKRRRVRGGGVVGSSSSSTRPVRSETGVVAADTETAQQLTDLAGKVSADDQASTAEFREVDTRIDGATTDDFSSISTHYGLLPPLSLIITHAYDGDADDAMLEQVKPRYIIMYDVDAPFIRRIEVYRSSHADRDVRSYLLYYADSVEEERYLAAVRREKDAFSKLIRDRASMALTLTDESEGTSAATPADSFLTRINTRIAGGASLAPAVPPRVVVDIREFRSSLPPLLHGLGIAVVPCHLTVGDYILSPRICVERKALPDLIASLASGRLWTQCESMFRHYAVPVLLIEFARAEAFTLERFADVSASGPSADLQTKLVLLTLAFPKLRIIWSSSPYETAEIFQSLKTQETEPEPRAAVEAGLVSGEKEVGDGGLGSVLQNMVMAVPGVTPVNLGLITEQARDVRQLANMSMEQLTQIVGREAAGSIHYFFNRRPGG